MYVMLFLFCNVMKDDKNIRCHEAATAKAELKDH
jgi:hypothetical protein